jgi:hypothetical protein
MSEIGVDTGQRQVMMHAQPRACRLGEPYLPLGPRPTCCPIFVRGCTS